MTCSIGTMTANAVHLKDGMAPVNVAFKGENLANVGIRSAQMVNSLDHQQGGQDRSQNDQQNSESVKFSFERLIFQGFGPNNDLSQET